MILGLVKSFWVLGNRLFLIEFNMLKKNALMVVLQSQKPE